MKNRTRKDFDDRIQFREWDTYDLSQDGELDKYALDVAAEEQSMLMQKWTELLTQAQAELKKAKEVFNNTDSDLFLQAKRDGIPDMPGSKAPTEGTVKAWVQTQPAYKKAVRKVRVADNNVTYLQNALKVLENKKAMIQVEANLWVTGYYARPHLDPEVKEGLESHAKEKHAKKLKDSLTKRHLRQQEENE